MNMKRLIEYQLKLHEWQCANFGFDVSPLAPALGIVEEFGEYFLAPTKDERIDAIGDAAIFLVQAASAYAFSFRDVVSQARALRSQRLTTFQECTSLLGYWAHIALKYNQGIRNIGPDEYVEAMARVWLRLEDMAHDEKTTLDKIFFTVADSVMNRNWWNHGEEK